MQHLRRRGDRWWCIFDDATVGGMSKTRTAAEWDASKDGWAHGGENLLLLSQYRAGFKFSSRLSKVMESVLFEGLVLFDFLRNTFIRLCMHMIYSISPGIMSWWSHLKSVWATVIGRRRNHRACPTTCFNHQNGFMPSIMRFLCLSEHIRYLIKTKVGRKKWRHELHYTTETFFMTKNFGQVFFRL